MRFIHCHTIRLQEFTANAFRKWIDEFLSDGFVDTFRMLHPDETNAFTCWCSSTNARQNNYGSRIDYIMVDKGLSMYLEKAEVHSEIYGSDHCPISATFHSLVPLPAERPPLDAAKNYKEFSGKQTNLKDFLNRDNHLPCRNSFDVPNGTKLKKNNSSDCRQANITKFFVKKPKLVESVQVDDRNGNDSKDVERFAVKSSSDMNQDASKKWKNLLAARNTPSCAGHNEPCVLRTVRKKGLNQGRKFWACVRGEGQSNDPNASCNHFVWANGKS